jgi:hypothetical protein
MAKKQTRRSISVSRATYERLKAFCETQGISMSQFVETRVGDFLATGPEVDLGPREVMMASPRAARPAVVAAPRRADPDADPDPYGATRSRAVAPVLPRSPMTSAAARYAVEPPLPIIKPRGEPVDVKPPTVPTADQIFTF